MAKSDTNEIAAGCCLLTILLLPVAVLFRAFVITRLWLWFAVPLGMSAIGIAHACGLSILAAILTHQADAVKDTSEDEPFESARRLLIYGVIGPAICWMFGWIFWTQM